MSGVTAPGARVGVARAGDARAVRPPARRWISPGFETFGSIFGFVYTFLAVNLLLAVSNAPLLVFLAGTADPAAAWPFFLLLSLTVCPSLAGAFSAFSALGNEDGAAARPVAAFVSGYRRCFGRALAVGAAAAGLLLFLLFDLVLLSGMPNGALLLPLVLLAVTVVISLVVTVLAGMVLLPAARMRSLGKAALFLCIQRWYLTLAALVLMGIIAGAVLVQPILGASLSPAPLLFVVWSNTSYAYTSALRTPEEAPHD